MRFASAIGSTSLPAVPQRTFGQPPYVELLQFLSPEAQRQIEQLLRRRERSHTEQLIVEAYKASVTSQHEEKAEHIPQSPRLTESPREQRRSAGLLLDQAVAKQKLAMIAEVESLFGDNRAVAHDQKARAGHNHEGLQQLLGEFDGAPGTLQAKKATKGIVAGIRMKFGMQPHPMEIEFGRFLSGKRGAVENELRELTKEIESSESVRPPEAEANQPRVEEETVPQPTELFKDVRNRLQVMIKTMYAPMLQDSPSCTTIAQAGRLALSQEGELSQMRQIVRILREIETAISTNPSPVLLAAVKSLADVEEKLTHTENLLREKEERRVFLLDRIRRASAPARLSDDLSELQGLEVKDGAQSIDRLTRSTIPSLVAVQSGRQQELSIAQKSEEQRQQFVAGAAAKDIGRSLVHALLGNEFAELWSADSQQCTALVERLTNAVDESHCVMLRACAMPWLNQSEFQTSESVCKQYRAVTGRVLHVDLTSSPCKIERENNRVPLIRQITANELEAAFRGRIPGQLLLAATTSGNIRWTSGDGGEINSVTDFRSWLPIPEGVDLEGLRFAVKQLERVMWWECSLEDQLYPFDSQVRLGVAFRIEQDSPTKRKG